MLLGSADRLAQDELWKQLFILRMWFAAPSSNIVPLD